MVHHRKGQPVGNNLTGRPWDYGTFDCYSLTRDYFAEKGVQLHDYPREGFWWERGESWFMDNFEKEGFVEIDQSELVPGCVIIMQIMSPTPNHTAVYLGDNVILHHLMNRLSSREIYGEFYRKVTKHVLKYVGK